MRNLLFIMLAMFATINLSAQKVRTNYRERFDVTAVFIDFNRNGIRETGEVFKKSDKTNFKCICDINFVLLPTGNNVLQFQLIIEHENEEESRTFKGMAENVTLFKDGDIITCLSDDLDKLFAIGKSGSICVLSVYEPLILLD